MISKHLINTNKPVAVLTIGLSALRRKLTALLDVPSDATLSAGTIES